MIENEFMLELKIQAFMRRKTKQFPDVFEEKEDNYNKSFLPKRSRGKSPPQLVLV